jgi:hypothetical protein
MSHQVQLHLTAPTAVLDPDIAVGQAIPQQPADRDRDDLGRKPEASED